MEDIEELVKCSMGNEIFYITHEVLQEVQRRMQLRGRHLLDYEQAAFMYGISVSSVRKLAKKAKAIRREEGLVLVDSTIMDEYIEKY